MEVAMNKKCLIAYSSLTGNTEKVALRFKETFENKGWQSDLLSSQKSEIFSDPLSISVSMILSVQLRTQGSLPYKDTQYAQRIQNGMDPG
jgi:hypothetical protein